MRSSLPIPCRTQRTVQANMAPPHSTTGVKTSSKLPTRPCAAPAVGLTVVIFILWPLLALPAKVFSQNYFTMWIVIALIWGSIAGKSRSAAYVRLTAYASGASKLQWHLKTSPPRPELAELRWHLCAGPCPMHMPCNAESQQCSPQHLSKKSR